MKIAVSANSNDLNQLINPVFGRCLGFLIIEVEEKKVKNSLFVENKAINSVGGAGIAAAQEIINLDVQAVFSGNFGPNAFLVLNQAGVKIYQVNGMIIQEAVDKFIAGELVEINKSNVPDKFGIGAGRGFGRSGRGFGRNLK